MHVVFAFALVMFVWEIFPSTAYAYIDPGIGSLLLQGLAASAISVLIFWRSLRQKIKDFFSKKWSR